MGVPEAIDYEAVLADLRARRDRLDVTISGIEQIAGISRNAESVGGMSNGSMEAPAPFESSDEQPLPKLGSDTFFGLSAVEGAKKYLNMVKRPVPMVEIHNALKTGGYLTTSQNFYANLYTAIMRHTDFQKVGKNWGLAEWYAGRRMPGPPPTPRKKGKKKTPRKPATTRVKKTATKSKVSEQPASEQKASVMAAPLAAPKDVIHEEEKEPVT